MKWKDLPIGTRIGALSALLSLLLILMGALSWRAMSTDRAQLDNLIHQAETSQQAVDKARSAQVAFKIQVQEWKNTLLRGGDPTAFAKYRDGFLKEGKVTQQHLTELLELVDAAGGSRNDVTEALQVHQQLMEKYLAALAKYDPATPDQSAHVVDAAVKGIDRAPTAKMDAIVATLQKSMTSHMAEAHEDASSRINRALGMMVALVVVALCVAAVASVVVMRGITTPLHEAVQVATRVADGRLDADFKHVSDDETGQVMTALQRMNTNLSQVVTQVRQAADMVVHASSEIASGNQDLSNRTEIQSSNLQQTASTIDELTSGVRNNAENANQANTLAIKACEVAEQGGQSVQDVVHTMNEIHESSKKIVDIISVIDSIAFQTNILALNAAVEAARAGEQGRGFAVVASEVRALAQRSANAAREIKELITNSVDRVERGSSLVGEAGSTISAAVTAVKQVRDVISEISVAVRDQAEGIAQISESIGVIDSTTQQNAALVEQAAAAASALKQQAEDLVRSVAFFSMTSSTRT